MKYLGIIEIYTGEIKISVSKYQQLFSYNAYNQIFWPQLAKLRK